LLSNHAHALIRTGELPLSQLMHRLLTGYVRSFNPRHHRCGHLFQNRFKNTLVEEEPYLLELVRYIHLNPVRSGLPVTIDSLDRYRWTGHAVLLGHRRFPAQDVDFILSQFGHTTREARRGYKQFILDGCNAGNIPDLEGGGLRRSAGGWEFVRKLGRGREKWAFDERVLGGPAFVEEILAHHQGVFTPRRTPPNPTLVRKLCAELARRWDVGTAEIASSSRRHNAVIARALVAFISVHRYGLTQSAVAELLHVSKQTISRGLTLAERILPLVEQEITDLLHHDVRTPRPMTAA
jgi:hypothetical protein